MFLHGTHEKPIGRDRDRAEIAMLLSAERMVTLTGPGGVGKTRLALAVAGDLEPRFIEGVAFVDLSAQEDAKQVPSLIAEAVGLVIPSGTQPIDAIARRVEASDLLIILDNAEHLPGIASIVSSLMTQTQRPKLLVTSRCRLRLRVEQVYPVKPLGLPVHDYDRQSASMELFERRARSLKPSFQIESVDLPAIAEVCRRVEGLPLALELAAARINVLTPQSMLLRLDQPLDLLAGGPTDLPERQQTMRNTIAWSHALLSHPEQAMLHHLAIFSGGWTLDAAEAVVGGTSSTVRVFEGINSLAEKHMVEIRDTRTGVRFSQLVSIRAFCLERLEESDNVTALRHRHASWFLKFLETAHEYWESGTQAHWLDRTAAEEANARSALDWFITQSDTEASLRFVIAMQMFWFVRGRITEGCEKSLAALALPWSHGLASLRIDALNGLAMMIRDGDAQLAARISQESLELATQLGDRKRKADVLANLGFLAMNRFDLASAETLFSECFQINEALGNDQGIADSLSFLAQTALHDGHIAKSIEFNERSLRLWQSLEDHQGVVWAKSRLALALACSGAYDRAHAELWTALQLARSLNFRWGLSWSFDGFASLAAQLGALALLVRLPSMRNRCARIPDCVPHSRSAPPSTNCISD